MTHCGTTGPATNASANQFHDRSPQRAAVPLGGNGGHESKLATHGNDMDPLELMKHRLKEQVPRWQSMSLNWHGVYLGFVVGPGKGDQSWIKPSRKYVDRCSIWAGRGHGLQYSALTYNTFAVSTLSYVAQLEQPPDWLYEEERMALKKVASGPRDWAGPDDFWHLKDGYGFCQAFKCIRWLAQAAQLRVYVCDKATLNKSELHDSVARTRQLMACPSVPYTRCIWKDWFARSFLLRLKDNFRYFCQHICSGQASIDTILGYGRRSSAREQESRIQGTLQRTAYNMICQRDNYDAEERVRNKQKRWYLSRRERHPHIQLNVRNSTPAWQAQRTHYTTCSYSTRLWRLACSLQRSVLSSIVGALRADTNSAAPT